MVVTVDAELKDIFPKYLENREADLVELDKELASNNFEGLRHIGHKIAGNAAGYGLEDLSQFSRQLESAAKEGDLGTCEKAVASMKTYLSELELVFE